MLKFIEPFIDVKIRLAQYLYINRGKLDQKRLCEELTISSSTYKRTLTEIEALYHEYYYNGSYYNSHSLIRIVKYYVGQSTRLALLKLLILQPGESAEFYRKHLILSDATFSRTIQQLKQELASYEVQIKVSSGYWIVAKNEVEGIMFAAHLASIFFWDQEEIKQVLIDHGGEEFLQEEAYRELEKFAFSDHPFVKVFCTNIQLFSLIMQYQQGKRKKEVVQVDPSLAVCYLESTMMEVTTRYHARISHTVHTVLHDTMTEPKRERLIELLVAVAFQWELFPYSVETVDLRQDFFVRKMSYLHPKREQLLDQFILRMHRLIHVPFNARRTSLIYFLISENLFTFETREAFQLFVYSSLGKNHSSFLLEHLEPLRHFYTDPFTITEIQAKEELYTDPKAIIVTNQAFDELPIENQYIVSDYLTMRDVLQFSVWLKERTSQAIDDLV